VDTVIQPDLEDRLTTEVTAMLRTTRHKTNCPSKYPEQGPPCFCEVDMTVAHAMGLLNTCDKEFQRFDLEGEE
jgi:hypothetical protein